MLQRLFGLLLLPLDRLDFVNVLSFPSVPMLCYFLYRARPSSLRLAYLPKATR
jgi:hypothetical protein